MTDRDASRRATLDRHDVADTGPEQVFDDLVRLAASACRTPVALLAFGTCELPWLGARVGLDPGDLRDLSLCTPVILRREPLEIADLAADPRLAAHPLVAAGPRLRCLAGAPLLDGEGQPLGALCVLDVVPRRLDDAQLRGLVTVARQVVAQLELRRRGRELAAQAAELARARADALASARAKDVFLANMGHELRTPLTAILGCAEILHEEAAAAGLDHLVPDLETIDRAGHHLVAVIEDILDLARLEAGVPQLRRSLVALAPLGAEIEAAVRPQLRGKQLRWRLAVEPDLQDIYTDATKLRQILINLVSNAIKFTAAGHVELAIRRALCDGRPELAFAVSDTGIGIAADKLPLLFRDFSQVHEPTAGYGGTGLGLAISRRFARLLGGDIDVDSDPGRGSCFTLRLPTPALDPAASV